MLARILHLFRCLAQSVLFVFSFLMYEERTNFLFSFEEMLLDKASNF